MSVTELSRAAGVAQSVVSGWRTDRRGLPETPTLFKLAKALRCTIEDLLQNIDEEYDSLRSLRRREIVSKLQPNKAVERVECGIEDGFIVLSDVEQLFYPYLIGLPRQLQAIPLEKDGLKSASTGLIEMGQSTPDEDLLSRVFVLSGELVGRLNARLSEKYDPDPTLNAAQRATLRQKEDAVARAVRWLNRSGSAWDPERDRERLAAEKSMPDSVRKVIENFLDLHESELKRERKKSLNHG